MLADEWFNKVCISYTMLTQIYAHTYEHVYAVLIEIVEEICLFTFVDGGQHVLRVQQDP
jgi:hypothetical protein